MSRLLAAAVSFLAACGSVHTSSEHASDGVDEAALLPVEPCSAPQHPELVGLWGRMTSYSGAAPAFHSALVYDGCHVTIAFRCPYVGDTLTTTTDRMALEVRLAAERDERRTLGIPEHRHYGDAHRTHAVWRGDVLVSVSEVSIDIEVARVREAEDGTPTLDLVWDTRRPIPLVRFGPGHVLDRAGIDLLRARDVVRRPGGWRVELKDGTTPVFIQPDGTVFERARKPPDAPDDPLQAFEEQHADLAVHDETGLTRWDGEAPDYAACVMVAWARPSTGWATRSSA